MALNDNVTQLWKLAEEQFPEIANIAKTEDDVPVEIMKDKYFSWKKKEKKGRRVKIRHLSRVESEPLKNVHDFIYKTFSPQVHANVFSYKTAVSPTACAEAHVNSYAVFMIDIKDFFPSIRRSMVQQIFEEYIYNSIIVESDSKSTITRKKRKARETAKLISILTTSADPSGTRTDEAVVLQGTKTAGNISNAVLFGLDVIMSAYAQSNGLSYTRYSDNMYFSKKEAHIDREVRNTLVKMVEDFRVAGNGFGVNYQKLKYSPHWRHQRVVGVVVNEKLNIPRSRERWLRSAYAHLFKDLDILWHKIVEKPQYTTEEAQAFKETIVQMKKQLRVVFGNHSYFGGVNRSKYDKYSSWKKLCSVYISMIETEMSIRTTEVVSGYDLTWLAYEIEYRVKFSPEILRNIAKPVLVAHIGSDYDIIPMTAPSLVVPISNQRNLSFGTYTIKGVQGTSTIATFLRRDGSDANYLSPSMIIDPAGYVRDRYIKVDPSMISDPSDIMRSMWRLRSSIAGDLIRSRVMEE